MPPRVLTTIRTTAILGLLALAAGVLPITGLAPAAVLAAAPDPACLNLPVSARTFEMFGCAALINAPVNSSAGLRAATAAGSAPAPTNSYYVSSADASACPAGSTSSCAVYGEGAYTSTPSGGAVVVLDFGAPCYIPGSSPLVYGTQLFGSKACTPFAILAGLGSEFIQGYASTHPGGTPQLTLVLGTSNSLTGALPAPNLLTQAQLSAHGAGWYAQVVAPIATSGLAVPISIWGGNDMEQASDGNWYDAADTIAWVTAYGKAAGLPAGVCDPSARGYLLDYGDDVVGGGPGVTDGWGAAQVYSVAWGLPGTCAMPEIYYSGLANEWQALNQWAVGQGKTPILFSGVLADPATTALSPDQAWGQLQALSGQSPPIRSVSVIQGGLAVPVPAIASISPASGTPGGGTSVTVTGSGFVNVTGVAFGGTPASSFSVTSESILTAVSPALAPSSTDITVSSGAGTSAVGPADRFSVLGAGAYHAQPPLRILDTRAGAGMPPNSTLPLPISGRGTVPLSGAIAVVLNVTVTNPTAAGFLTVYPAGGSRPLASNLNFSAGQTVPNLVEVPIGAGGQVELFNYSGTADVIVDLEGWVGPAGNFGAGLFNPLSPQRMLDTRDSRPLDPAGTLDVQVAGQQGVPAIGATAVILNLTVTNPTAAGFLTLYPAGGSRPLASNLNFRAGQTVPNLVVVPLGNLGRITVFNSAGLTDVVADIEGWVSDGAGQTTGRLYSPLPPARILDTRAGGQPIGAAATLTLQVSGHGGAPAAGVVAVVLNLTATNPTADGYLSVYPHGAVAAASNLNFVPGETVPNLVVVPVDGLGQIDIHNFSGSTDVIVDIEGWYS